MFYFKLLFEINISASYERRNCFNLYARTGTDALYLSILYCNTMRMRKILYLMKTPFVHFFSFFEFIFINCKIFTQTQNILLQYLLNLSLLIIILIKQRWLKNEVANYAIKEQ